MEIPGYRIEKTIGAGGMATAYLAQQTSLGRKVVLKVLDTSHADSPQTIERFLNEGRIIASLNHPHIITIYDIGIADDVPYISMEYVEGGDLRERLEKHTFTPAQALDLIKKIGSALQAAHENGIVHRDVKPGNILYRRDRTPLLSDFGIAKKLATDHDLTSTGIFLGSPNYMAPEQADAGAIDGRVDIYALGVIFFEVLTGRKPYGSDSVVGIIMQHKQAPVPKLPAEFADYQELLDLLMAKNRKDRFRDCQSMIHYVEHLEKAVTERQTLRLDKTPPASVRVDTAPHEVPTVQGTLVLEAPPPKRPIHAVLLVLLLLSSAMFAALLYVESRFTREESGLAEIPAPVSPVAEAAAAPPPVEATGPAPDAPAAAPVEADVINALTWLGQKSLEDYRLTSPSGDNAFYYFSRLNQIAPGSDAAREGLLQVAERFAFLAERELANNNVDKARQYIAVGLQVNPGSQTLRTLDDLAQPSERGLLSTILGFFRAGD
jgi:serine/threonine-protein kinase PpkA